MAKISETVGRKDENSGYSRLLGNAPLGHLVSRVHATTIRAGTELEHLIEGATSAKRKATLEDAIRGSKPPRVKGIQIVFNPKIKKTSRKRGTTGDVLVVDHTARMITLIELKDGDTFDTKKASGELQSLKSASMKLARKMGYKPNIRFCSFNQESKESIVRGAKGRFSPDQVMTGRELCGILKIDWDKFGAARRQEQASNLEYFLSQLASIPEIGKRLRRMLR